ncbi:DUF29 domain-containing protein [Argonema galeatum A003/A1]|nr:DUF29 domain-containing protein [Argonema galeatum A003/A1]
MRSHLGKDGTAIAFWERWKCDRIGEKLQYWTSESDYNAVHWQEEIYTFRIQLRRRITTNLRNYLESELNSIYKDALGFVKIKTQNAVSFLPECPYSLDQLLDIEWLPSLN